MIINIVSSSVIIALACKGFCLLFDINLLEKIMKMRPLNDHVLVQRVEGAKKTAGGIIIPDNANEKPVEGHIVAVGPGKLNDVGERVALQVKKGDAVLFSKYGGTDVKIDGENYLIMREDDVLGVIVG
jgi:chaperonin GroES